MDVLHPVPHGLSEQSSVSDDETELKRLATTSLAETDIAMSENPIEVKLQEILQNFLAARPQRECQKQTTKHVRFASDTKFRDEPCFSSCSWNSHYWSQPRANGTFVHRAADSLAYGRRQVVRPRLPSDGE
jgi:hypothetical protein